MFRRTPARGQHHTAYDLLSAYLDGQVTPSERDQVEQHLRACAACARELESLRYTKNLLQAVPSVSLPRAFTLSEATVGVAVAHRRPAHLVSYLQGATALVAALLLVVIAGDFLRLGALLGTPAPAVEKAVVATVVVEAQATPELQAELMMAAAPAAEVPAAEAPADEAAVAEAEAPQELLAAALVTEAPDEAAATEAEAAPRAAAIVAEPETQDLLATPLGAPAGMGGGPEETLASAAAAQQADEGTAEAVLEGNQLLLEATPIPEAMLKQAPAPVEVTAAPEAMPIEAPAPTEAPPATPAPAEEVAVAPVQMPATAAPSPQPETPVAFTAASQPAVASWWTTRRVVEALLVVLLAILLALTLWLRRRR